MNNLPAEINEDIFDDDLKKYIVRITGSDVPYISKKQIVM